MFKLSGLAAAVLIAGLTANVSVANATWDEAAKAFAKKEYQAALKLFRPLAEKGNALAQYNIALMHRMGLGVTKDQREARKWSRLAAKQGNTDAQVMLGSLYAKADGGEFRRRSSRLHVVRGRGRAGQCGSEERTRRDLEGADAAADLRCQGARGEVQDFQVRAV